MGVHHGGAAVGVKGEPSGNAAGPTCVRTTMRPRSRYLLAALGLSLTATLVALAWPAGADGEEPCRAAEIRVYKQEGAVELLCDGAVRRTMAATFGGNPVGAKEQEGDQRTPEGTYRIASKVKSERFH